MSAVSAAFSGNLAGGTLASTAFEMRTAIALGSNLGDRLDNLRAARKEIVELVGVQSPILSSAIYETDPIGCEPVDLWKQLAEIEVSLGRSRDHARNVSREIDIDLLYADETKIDDQGLQLPHPRVHLRKFVLQPLADIRPDLILPNQTKTVRELLAQLHESGNVVCLTNDWESR